MTAPPVPPDDPTRDVTRVARLLALDPAGLGGVWLRGPAGEARDAVLARLRAAWPADTPWRRLPLQIDDERLQGGLDLAASLAAGRPVHSTGLIEQARGGVLLLPMAERASAGLVARLAAAVDTGALLLALDEGVDADESLAAPLAERLALVLRGDVMPAEPGPSPERTFDPAAARATLATIPFDADAVEALCAAAQALGLDSMRPAWQAWRLACLSAACEGRDRVTQDDAEFAARLVLAPRARALPQAPAEPEQEPDQAPAPNAAETPPPPADAAASPPTDPAPEPPAEPGESAIQTDQLVAAALAALPPDLLARLAAGKARRSSAGAGRMGTSVASRSGGRPVGARRGLPRDGARLDLLATLRAAVPWQRLRREAREAADLPPASTRLLLRRDDLHVRRLRRPQPTTTVFVVDASGSQALHRLAEAKGAVELLLADCYVRRDQVALIAFRGKRAETLLAPTRSLVRARRALSALPGGGGTPLSQGIAAATELALRLQASESGRAQLVFLTDARANIDHAGQPGRERAMQDALGAARRLASTGVRSLLIDTSPRPQAPARALAQAMAGHYLALPLGQARALSAAVQSLT
ncbi:magnesium chelatase subunit D [Sphaerotilus mobilis]|uniref:Protoporphyrin IX magnesium-chelatase n=1 Tax=Sphaerotilus mobilis TaxID=47994 RepID=A0A4Q7LVZ0_9BURK|nr:magnesium chelatase subunit D [Sphaerotilus mobilis]RZS58542.1 protoporphyrin IX magnesium-chelatase [Sphaerotilus mobilis]